MGVSAIIGADFFVNEGTVIAASFSGPGFQHGATVNPGGTFQAGAGLGDPIVLQSGTLATTLPGTTQLTFGDVTAATAPPPRYASPIRRTLPRPAKPSWGNSAWQWKSHRAFQPNRCRRTAACGCPAWLASDYSGTITAGNRVKVELNSNTSGAFSPMGTGKVVLTAGTTTRPAACKAPITGPDAHECRGHDHLRQQHRTRPAAARPTSTSSVPAGPPPSWETSKSARVRACSSIRTTPPPIAPSSSTTSRSPAEHNLLGL